ncbi:MAG: hypothetical protein IPM58_04195 [Nitrospira sp.]|nr:hypothetical protein [Nitrospira sp.]
MLTSGPQTRLVLLRSVIVRTTALLCLCLVPWGVDQVAAQSVEIIPHWKTGDRVELIVTRVREKSLDGRTTRSGKTHTRFSLEVLRTGPPGYLVGWTVGATTFEVPAPSESILRHVVGLMQGLQIQLEIDPRGAITGVQNWEALRKEMRKKLDALSDNAAASQREKADQALIENLRAQWDVMFSSKTQIEQVCMRDAQIYFRILGRTYTRGQHDAYQSELDNPLGGAPLPAHTDIVLKSFDDRSRHAVLHWKQSADREQTDRIMRSIVKGLAAQRGKQVPEERPGNTVSLENYAEVEVDVGTGWITKLTETKAVNLGTRAQTDTTFMVREVKTGRDAS